MYTILLLDDVAVDPRVHADVVAKHLGLSRLEAKMRIRKGRGIFLEQLSEEAARAISEHLESAGIKTRVVAPSEIPPLPQPRKVGRIDRGPEAFTYRAAGSDETDIVAWDSLAVVSCGLVARSESKHDPDPLHFRGLPALHKVEAHERAILRENLILKMERPPEEKKRPKGKSVFERLDESRNLRVVLDLLTADFGRWLRVVQDEFGYVLTEGAVQMGAPWGFESFVNDLRARAAAAFTDMTLDILAAEDFSPLLLAGLDDLNRYTTWAILRKKLHLEPEIPWAEREA